MGHSQAEKAQSRERILDVAARQIRKGGLDSVSIADLMKTANLTHGGFYGHFASRAALIAAALDRALQRGETAFVSARRSGAPSTIKSMVNSYLSPAHRDNLAEGCAIATLAAEVGRAADPELRAPMARQLEITFERASEAMGGGPEADEAAMTAWSMMVGALALSRVYRGTPRSDEILKSARKAVLELAERTARKGSEDQAG